MMEDFQGSVESTPVESAPPVAESAPSQPETRPPNVYGETPGYSDASRALAGNMQQAQQAPETPAITEAPKGQRFGLSEERKQQLANELKAQKTGQPVATAVAPAKMKAAPKAPVDHVAVIGDYFSREDRDPADMLGRLYDSDYDRYERLIEHVITSNRDHAARILGFDAGPRADDFPMLPKELRQTAANLSPDALWEISQLPPEMQIRQLEREAKFQEMEQREWEAQEQHAKAEQARIEKESFGAVKKTSENFVANHRKTLADFMPFEDKESNDGLHNLMLRVVSAEMAGSGQWESVRREAAIQALQAPFLAAQGRDDEAAIMRGASAELTAQYSSEFGRMLKAYRDLLANEFRDAKLWREHQRKQGEAEKSGQFDSTDRDLVPGTRYYRPKRG